MYIYTNEERTQYDEQQAWCLQRLTMIPERQEPTKLTVFGSALGVNGEYHLSTRFKNGDGSPIYISEHQLSGKNVHLTTRGTSIDPPRWTIMIPGSGGIFVSNPVSEDPSLPPNRGWWPQDGQVALSKRPPIVSFDDEKIID
jgi:hypothetical protein